MIETLFPEGVIIVQASDALVEEPPHADEQPSTASQRGPQAIKVQGMVRKSRVQGGTLTLPEGYRFQEQPDGSVAVVPLVASQGGSPAVSVGAGDWNVSGAHYCECPDGTDKYCRLVRKPKSLSCQTQYGAPCQCELTTTSDGGLTHQ